MKNDAFKKIPIARPELSGREREYVLDAVNSGWVSSIGKYIPAFEKAFADYIGVKHALACSNGTVALHLALMALDIGPGDEVIVPALTYVATANAVTYTGATPVFADSESKTWNIDPKSIEALVTAKTKAVIAVHLYGHSCDMAVLSEIAKKHGLKIIEDSAEALGSEYKDKKCGALSEIATFSFYGNKTVTTGEGGMVVTDDDELARRVALLKGQGMDQTRRYWFTQVGYNYRMTNVAAAIGLAQMERIGEFVEKRRAIARRYAEKLSGVKGIKLQAEESWAKNACWLFSILIEDSYGMGRDALIEALDKNGVETRPFFYSMHTLPVYLGKNRTPLLTAEHLSATGLNLPTFSGITEGEVDYVSSLVIKNQKR